MIKKMLLVGMLVTTLLSAVGCNSTKKGEGVTTSDAAGEKVGFDGTYTGEGMGHGGAVKLDLIIENAQIKDIVIGENHETVGLGDNAMETMKTNMIGKNQIVVDTVTGATISSKGFSDAVKDAFSKSGQRNRIWLPKKAA